MTVKIDKKQIEAVLKTEAQKRYKYFMGIVADQEEAWGLYDNGWALAGDDEGHKIFPLWPTSEYAKLCTFEDWGEYKPKRIPIDELMEDLLPKLKEDGILIGVFYTPANKGVVVGVEEFLKPLEYELSRY